MALYRPIFVLLTLSLIAMGCSSSSEDVEQESDELMAQVDELMEGEADDAEDMDFGDDFDEDEGFEDDLSEEEPVDTSDFDEDLTDPAFEEEAAMDDQFAANDASAPFDDEPLETPGFDDEPVTADDVGFEEEPEKKQEFARFAQETAPPPAEEVNQEFDQQFEEAQEVAQMEDQVADTFDQSAEDAFNDQMTEEVPMQEPQAKGFKGMVQKVLAKLPEPVRKMAQSKSVLLASILLSLLMVFFIVRRVQARRG